MGGKNNNQGDSGGWGIWVLLAIGVIVYLAFRH